MTAVRSLSIEKAQFGLGLKGCQNFRKRFAFSSSSAPLADLHCLQSARSGVSTNWARHSRPKLIGCFSELHTLQGSLRGRNYTQLELSLLNTPFVTHVSSVERFAVPSHRMHQTAAIRQKELKVLPRLDNLPDLLPHFHRPTRWHMLKRKSVRLCSALDHLACTIGGLFWDSYKVQVAMIAPSCMKCKIPARDGSTVSCSASTAAAKAKFKVLPFKTHSL